MFYIKYGVVMLLFAASLVLADARSEKLLNQVQKNYEKLEKVCADFTQTFHWKMTGETQQISGKICALGGDKFRIETDEQVIVTDGKTLWTLNKQSNQVIVDYAENAASDNPFIKDFLDKYIREYNSQIDESASTDDKTVVLLTSKTGDHFVHRLRLWTGEKSNLITKIEQVDLNDNTTIFEINNINTEVSLSNSDFKFDVPADADVIDMR